MRILVVDDDVTLCRVYGAWLQRAGHQTVVTSDPDEALRLLDPRIQVVISDLEMPGMTGVAMIEQMRQTRPNLGVVFATGANRRSKLWAQAAELGPVVAKSGNFRETLDEIVRLIDGPMVSQPPQRHQRALSPTF